jgi:hypothetical protein
MTCVRRWTRKIIKLSNQSAKALLEKWFWQKIVLLLVTQEINDTLSAVKIISKTHIKKKPFLQKYIDQ